MNLPVYNMKSILYLTSNKLKIYLSEGNPKFQQADIEEFNDLWSDFVKNEGKRLDKLLKDQDTKNSDTNFVNEPWTDMYLRYINLNFHFCCQLVKGFFRDRRPILMNYNPTVVLTDAGQKGNGFTLKEFSLISR